jgi:hypothetical protein
LYFSLFHTTKQINLSQFKNYVDGALDKNQAVHLLSYTVAAAQTDLTVENNIFFRAKGGMYYYNTVEEHVLPVTLKAAQEQDPRCLFYIIQFTVGSCIFVK